ncbi:MAG: phosphoenolpyruvate carboxylase [Pseudomonadota bacterium]
MKDTQPLPLGGLLNSKAGPFQPTDTVCFQAAENTDCAELTASLIDDLRRHEGAREEDPFSNPVLLLALDIGRRLERGDIKYADLEQLTQYLTVEGWLARAERLRRYVGETDPAANDERLRAAFANLAKPRDSDELGNDASDKVRFEIFKTRVEAEVFGIVITAHPTFTQPTELMRGIAALVSGRGNDGKPLTRAQAEKLVRQAATTEHKPDADMSLAREHALSLEVIANLHEALYRAYDLLLDVAAKLYPDRWLDLVPRLVTIASWVGYDLDGRSDIRWTDTLNKRMVVQRMQLERYLSRTQALMADRASAPAGILETLELVESRLALALTQINDEIDVFGLPSSTAADDVEAVKRISRRMYEGRAMRLSEAGTLVELFDRALNRIVSSGDSDADPLRSLTRQIAILRAELANYGLGAAHTHVRINATQVHNSIRKAVDLVSDPNDPRYRQSYLDRINTLLESVEPVTINFGSVMAEQTSVKRLFMIVAQMLKYTGRTAPIRFLIAETESPFTTLTALYYARLFGVEDHVDISPLFETERALEVGSRFIGQLLENPHYHAYVEKRGRICVQTGYSDAGRFIGQTPANASIERLRLRLTRVIAKHREQGRLSDVQLLIFDTHGESIGRGSHPENFEQRLANIDTAASRGFLADNGVPFKQEMSFQGGDGYLYFVNQPLAYAALTRILEHTLRYGDNSADDLFYDEASYIREFFTTVKEFQVDLMNDTNYGVLLMAFGVNLLFQSGSRATKRQYDDPSDIDHANAAQLRAIPHNAVLQQLGLLANTVGGLGAAIAKDPDRFQKLYATSPRLRQLMGIVEYGAAVSNPMIMKAYVDSLDPVLWIIRAGQSGRTQAAEDMLRLAHHYEENGLHARQVRVFRTLFQDFTMLEQALSAVRGEEDGGSALISAEAQERLCLLHAIRIAVLHELFRLAMRLPSFSNRHSITPKQLVDRLLHLDVDEVVDLLAEIFPRDPGKAQDEDFGEAASYVSDETQSYRFENEMIFDPMRGLYRLARRLSTAICHRVGFLG